MLNFPWKNDVTIWPAVAFIGIFACAMNVFISLKFISKERPPMPRFKCNSMLVPSIEYEQLNGWCLRSSDYQCNYEKLSLLLLLDELYFNWSSTEFQRINCSILWSAFGCTRTSECGEWEKGFETCVLLMVEYFQWIFSQCVCIIANPNIKFSTAPTIE